MHQTQGINHLGLSVKDLDRLLRTDGIDHRIICGVTTQCCVHSTLRKAVARGCWCLTVANCCAATEAGMHDAALQLIAGEGHLLGWVADSSDMDSGIAAFRKSSNQR